MSRKTEWWQSHIPNGEDVLWVGRPDQGYFPPRLALLYFVTIGLLIGIWITSPWLVESIRGLWKILFVTIGFAFFLWADRFLRTQRVYVVTSHYARQINKIGKSKKLEISPFLSFSFTRRRLSFDRHPFFSFDHLSDPDDALKALEQAREASK